MSWYLKKADGNVFGPVDDDAVAVGVWGVPTFGIRGQLFWGEDTLEWMNAFIDNPALFDSPGMRRADSTGAGVVRRQ